jgi:hypothetical protein
MDERYLLAGVGLLFLSMGVYGAGFSHSLWAWGIPFAFMLLFLGLLGSSPRNRWREFVPAPPIHPPR